MNAAFAAIRQHRCETCPTPCEPWKNGTINLADPALACPIRRWFPVAPQKGKGLRLGDKLEKLFKPIARALKLPCLDANADLKPESPCAKRRDRLNEL